jgi:hypothetical protein
VESRQVKCSTSIDEYILIQYEGKRYDNERWQILREGKQLRLRKK